jgi:hypothetical protein
MPYTTTRGMTQPSALPIASADVKRELASDDARVVTAAASALGALAVRVQLPTDFAALVDDLLDALVRGGAKDARKQASVLAALSGLCAGVDGARGRALDRGAVATVTREALGANDGGVHDEEMDAVRVNALDFFRFLQHDDDRRGFEAVRGDSMCMAFVLASARERGSRELDFMKRVGGVDLVVNFAQQVAGDDEKFDALIREGAFEVFTHALLADEDEVTVRGLIGLACALPRRRALRVKLAEDGECVRRLATLMGSSTDESLKGFAGGLFRALALDPETKGLVEKALREGGADALQTA